MAPGSTSTRWCPTPEQLMILEEMYRGGVRTPNAPQIQHITAHLSLYGKIEGKNVFYWFQNHKARDRQKLRRRLAKHLLLQHQHTHHLNLCHHDHYFHQTQFSYQIQTPDLHFINSIHPPPPPLSPSGTFHPLPTHDYYTQPQGDVSSQQPLSCSWKMDMSPARCDEKMKNEEPEMRTHGEDWVVISSNLNSRPLKTLELFPVSSSSCNPTEF